MSNGNIHLQVRGCASRPKRQTGRQDHTAIPPGETVSIGTTGKSQRMEAIEIHLLDENDKPVEGFQYASHLENIGWEGYVNNGSFTGTRHQCCRLEALRFAYPEADKASK